MSVLRWGRIFGMIDSSSTPETGQVAAWDAASGSYKPTTPAGSGGSHATSHQNNGADEISVQGLSGLLADAQTPASHGHAQSEVTGLVTALTGKQSTSEKAQANGYASLGADGLVPSAQLPVAGGGADPWVKVILGADFPVSVVANTVVPGLTFTPQANKRYLVQAYLLLRTATATVGPRPGFAWPSGTTDGGAYMQAPSSATAVLYRTWGARATQAVANTGVPDTTNSHLATGEAYVIMGASPSGTFGVTLASETAGTSVTVKAGSFLMYREI